MTVEVKSSLVSFIDTIKYPRIFLWSVGMDPYPMEKPTSERTVHWNFFYHLAMWNLRLADFVYFVYLYRAIRNSANFLDSTIMIPCLICCILSEFKVATFQRNHEDLDRVLKFLDEKFPKTQAQQNYFGLDKVHGLIRNLSKVHTTGITTWLWCFNLLPLIQSSFEYFLTDHGFIYRLPYVVWYPFDYEKFWPYLAVNSHLFFAGHAVAQYYIGGDTMLFSVVYQICMHFDNVSKQLLEYQPKGSNDDREGAKLDYDHLTDIIRQHNELLEICNSVNQIFSNVTFLNFLASAGIICLVAFRVTVSGFDIDVVKFLVYIGAMVAQIFMLCYFGDRLIQSSTAVCQSAFQHNWFDAHVAYKKAMIFLMMRAQKPATLTASYFAIVSFESFKAIMTTSYQFFAVLHSSYSK